MLKERRRSIRQPVEFEVNLRYRQRRFPVAQASNLSPEGIYVQTTNLTLPIGTLIEIELDRRDRQWVIPAIVVHSDTQGVGLLFQTPQPELFEYAMSALIAARPSPPAAPEAAAVPA